MHSKNGKPMGRPPGAKNKSTKEREAAMQAAAARLEGTIEGAFQGDAHTFLVAIYKDPSMPVHLRVDAAKAAVAYEKPRLNASDVNLRQSDQSVMDWLRELDGKTRGIPAAVVN
jgi:hypothetical protein